MDLKLSIKYIYLNVLVLMIFGQTVFAEQIQSKFVGPLATTVWKHWQASWNVDDKTSTQPLFELTRGFNENGRPFIRLKYRDRKPRLKLKIHSEYLSRFGKWEMVRKKSPSYTLEPSSEVEKGITEFYLSEAKEFVDQSNELFVTTIHLSIEDGIKTVFELDLLPMYVRGRDAHYWNNPIDSFSAHAGIGDISIATASASERGDLDTWGGVLIKPILNYIERNTLSPGAVIGLHRHEQNQEMFFLESGSAIMRMGMAKVSSSIYKAKHRWESGSSELKETDEFEATGGWLESRELKPGQFAIIVPDKTQKDDVYMHGIDAITQSVFWTLGSKN